MHKTITLPSDNKPIRVRVLELYELDKVPFDDPGEYELTYENGQTQSYNLSHWPDGEPEKPDTPKDACEVGSLHWAMWNRWELYQAVLAHHFKRLDALDQKAHDDARYIRDHCLAAKDRKRIVEPDDLEVVIAAASVKEVGMEDIDAALAATFPGFVPGALHPGRLATVAAG